LVVEKDGELLASPTFQLDNLSASEFDLSPIEEVTGEKESIKAIVKNRSALSSVDLHLPSGDDIRMSGLRKFAAVVPLYTLQEDGETLYNNRTEETLRPNMEVGYYQPVDENGQFVGSTVSPGFVVNIGT
ncbi:maltose ABC transporter permease MalF, partial [Vibrio sp. OPT46]|nr:maltose ABC transporter permease MalF [Vibrio sp. OPT46]